MKIDSRYLAAAVAVGLAACGGGGSSSTPTAPSPGGGATVPTITITADGVAPKTIDIKVGQQVRFVNSDSRNHEMLSTPHLLHTDCPPINLVGNLTPGANKMTGNLNAVRICGFHDHQNPDDQRFRGQINVDTAEGPAPGYVTGR
jgi:plastocyanin